MHFTQFVRCAVQRHVIVLCIETPHNCTPHPPKDQAWPLECTWMALFLLSSCATNCSPPIPNDKGGATCKEEEAEKKLNPWTFPSQGLPTNPWAPHPFNSHSLALARIHGGPHDDTSLSHWCCCQVPHRAPRSPWLCFEQRIWSLHSSIEADLRPCSLKPGSSDGFSACCWWNSHCTALGCSCVHVSGLTGSHSARATQTHLCCDLARSPRAVVVGARFPCATSGGATIHFHNWGGGGGA